MSKYHYVVLTNQPTLVTHSLTGNFTGEKDLNLILGKSTHFEIYKITKNGLEIIEDVPIYGKIICMKLFRISKLSKDLLFILVEKYLFCILDYDSKTGKIITKFRVDVEDQTGKEIEREKIAIIDSTSKIICMQFYDSHVKLLSIDPNGKLGLKAVNSKIDELEIKAMSFVINMKGDQLLAILYMNNNKENKLKTYGIDMKNKILNICDTWKEKEVESSSHTLIPMSYQIKGVLVVGNYSISYHNGEKNVQKTISPTYMICYTYLDKNGSRIILGDKQGKLYVLTINTKKLHSTLNVSSLFLNYIGQVNTPSTLSYLDNGVLFVGSKTGDSQLIKLHTNVTDNNYINILKNYTNLGPIQDLSIVDLDKIDQSQAIMCSGAHYSGSLRILRRGVGIKQKASIQLNLINGVWSIYIDSSKITAFIILSFIYETKLFEISKNCMKQIKTPLFFNKRTIYCSNIKTNIIVYITNLSVKLIKIPKFSLIFEWSPDNNSKITKGQYNGKYILISTNKKNIYLLQIVSNIIEIVDSKEFEWHISSLYLFKNKKNKNEDLVLLSFWNNQDIFVLTTPKLSIIAKKTFKNIKTVLSSIMLINFIDEILYLFCGFGNGSILIYKFNAHNKTFSEKKRIHVGIIPITFNLFKQNNENYIFICSDKPTIIFKKNNEIQYSNVNLSSVNYITDIISKESNNNFLFATNNELKIGSIDYIRKINVQKVEIKAHVRRIAHSALSSTFCIVATNYDYRKSPLVPVENDCISLLDDKTFEILDTYKLHKDNICSLICVECKENQSSYFVISTAYIDNKEYEPKDGHILIFKVIENKMYKIFSYKVTGAILSMCYSNKKLFCCINSNVQMFKWIDSDANSIKLSPECGVHGFLTAISLKNKGNKLIVGDLFQSISLIEYKPETNVLIEVTRDYHSYFPTAIEILDENTFLVADDLNNLILLKKTRVQEEIEYEREKISVIGKYHLGMMINVIRKGTLTRKINEEIVKMEDGEHKDFNFQINIKNKYIFGTVEGAVGIIAELSESQFKFLKDMEKAMEHVIYGCGGFYHNKWREFNSPNKKERVSNNFIDGDLIEQFTKLSEKNKETVAKRTNLPLEFIKRQINDIKEIK